VREVGGGEDDDDEGQGEEDGYEEVDDPGVGFEGHGGRGPV
jgi:hypothetical protein